MIEGFFSIALYAAVGVYGIFALAILRWAYEDPVLFLPLLLSLPCVAAFWLYGYRQWSAMLGFSVLLIQAFCLVKFEARRHHIRFPSQSGRDDQAEKRNEPIA